ncbi:hypothetical protein [Enterocloster citroniae]|uniref:hypothetical protein n=1 Tax=Enterocloster citroniae TaxID=358743 RepID=UPI001FA8D872|nr:hypothetical protein [Enterocloster citroniae]
MEIYVENTAFSTLFGLLYCTVTDVYAFASWQFLVSRYLMLFGTWPWCSPISAGMTGMA